MNVSFDPFRFETATGRLWCGMQEVRLTPKAAAVLGELVVNAGEPVSKENLFATVWAGTVVSDDALTSCIQELRRAFEDEPKQPRYIETRHRRGTSGPTERTALRHCGPLAPKTGLFMFAGPRATPARL